MIGFKRKKKGFRIDRYLLVSYFIRTIKSEKSKLNKLKLPRSESNARPFPLLWESTEFRPFWRPARKRSSPVLARQAKLERLQTLGPVCVDRSLASVYNVKTKKKKKKTKLARLSAKAKRSSNQPRDSYLIYKRVT